MQRSLISLIFYLTITCNQNVIEAGFLTNYPSTAAVGTTIVQDSYSVPPYTGSGAVETIGYDYSAAAAPISTPIVEKKIYVHVPPQVTDQSLQYGPPPPPPRKHYKIIFVKAPSPPTPPPTTPEVEEKTLVYVLVKKPEPPTIQEVQNNVKPSKPEVYFINYKTQKEGSSQDHSHGSSGGGAPGSGLLSGSLGNSIGSGVPLSGGDDNSLGGGFSGLGTGNSVGGDRFTGVSFSGGSGQDSSNSLSPSLAPPSSTYLPPISSYLPPNFIK